MNSVTSIGRFGHGIVWKISVLALGLLAALLPLRTSASDHGADAKPHWTYDGESGPEHWGALSEDFKTCQSGAMQSPVDLKWSKSKPGGPVRFDYAASTLRVIDNGHTIQVNFAPGSRVNLRGQWFDLVQMHFHTASEHTIAGKAFPMELHFVHKNKAGKLAVVGVMFKEGNANPWIEKIWANIPKEKNKETTVEAVAFNPENLLPPSKTYYHYMGSLTTPPCSEGVNWNVMNTPVEMSKEQIEKFRAIYANNARPVQALHGRKPANF
jgi:carbonic anhydrase